ncbi:MAG TPA: ribbon-helix-helix protein, CopG family [Candidatus Limnocylindria bacterium]|nr:ribbon-helix-helix protein, CopG family [Candidatus Limnocylindria bacterium]
MNRTTLSIPQQLRDRVRRLAAERGVSMSEIIRQAIDEKLESARPRPRSLGIGSSGTHDTARRSASERPEPRSWR